MRHPFYRKPAGLQQHAQRSVAAALRARGFARGVGALPQAFDMSATVLTPTTRRLGGLGLLDPKAVEGVVENWQPSWGVPTYGGGTPTLTSPTQPLPGDPIPTVTSTSVQTATEANYAAPSLSQDRVAMVSSQAATIPGIIEGQSTSYVPEMNVTTSPPGTMMPVSTDRMRDIFTGSGVPAASDNVDAARTGSSTPYLDYTGDTATAGPVNQVYPQARSTGWPWWVWALIAGGVAMGVYGLTRR